MGLLDRTGDFGGQGVSLEKESDSYHRLHFSTKGVVGLGASIADYK